MNPRASAHTQTFSQTHSHFEKSEQNTQFDYKLMYLEKNNLFMTGLVLTNPTGKHINSEKTGW